MEVKNKASICKLIYSNLPKKDFSEISAELIGQHLPRGRSCNKPLLLLEANIICCYTRLEKFTQATNTSGLQISMLSIGEPEKGEAIKWQDL